MTVMTTTCVVCHSKCDLVPYKKHAICRQCIELIKSETLF